MDLGPPLDGSLARLRVQQEAFIDRVERFVQVAVADSRAAPAAAAVASLLLLALMLDRVGGSLAAVVAELRAGTDRKRFASELAEALDGVDSEAEAFGVIERAMGHAAGGRPMELCWPTRARPRSSGWRSAGRVAPPAARWSPRGAAWPFVAAPHSPSRPARR
jgi:hypothetical protein